MARPRRASPLPHQASRHGRHRHGSSLIIWLNGPFGAGKTTLAAGLSRALSGATVADPEAVGDLLRSALADHELKPQAYQDIPLWRQLPGAFIAGLAQHTKGPVIVPMTVLYPAYGKEMFTGLRQTGRFHHVIVHAEPAALLERIEASCECPGDPDRSEAVRAYRRRRAADYQQAAAPWPHSQGHVVDATALTADRTLQAALAHLRTVT